MKAKGEKTHLLFWWPFPCKAISGVFRELAERLAYRVTVICARDLIEVRKLLGHERPDYGKAEAIVLSLENWKAEADRILDSSRGAIHVFCGVRAYERIHYSLRRACDMAFRTAVMTEAHNNSFTGMKWLGKEIYARTFLPFTTRRLARRCLFVLCLSGNSQASRCYLRRVGWRDDQIFPFGYFSEQPPDMLEPSSLNHAAGERQLICTGYLTRNKGHHILLRALSLLKRRDLRFHCHITGYGPEAENLHELSKSLGLDSSVTFKGVISDEELGDLMRSADVFVAPGLREAWGIRINEALQAGLAVIVSDGIGACELVQASGGGVVFPSGNPEQLASALFSLMSNPDRLIDCKKRSRDYRHRIHPCRAAWHFDEVLRHTLEQKGKRPTVPWL